MLLSPHCPHQISNGKYITKPGGQERLNGSDVYNSQNQEENENPNDAPSPLITPYQKPRSDIDPEDFNSTLDNYRETKKAIESISDPDNEQGIESTEGIDKENSAKNEVTLNIKKKVNFISY